MSNPFQKPKWKVCPACDKGFIAEWARQSYCPPCQEVRKTNLKFQAMGRTEASKTAAYAAVAVDSSKQKTSFFEAFDRPLYDWHVTFSVPYSISSSKNKRWVPLRGGRGVYIPDHVRSYSELISLTTKRALEGHNVFENRVWLSFFVQKPDHKSDAVNVVDTFCDAIKGVIGVDDRWFSLDMVNWEIRKHEPQIYVRIGQADCFDARACSYCGGIFPLESFHKQKANRLGRGRECKECKAVVSAKRKELAA